MELSEIMKELKKMGTLKEQAIEKLLAQRSEIDSQLAQLGHGGVKQRRKRRTKEQMLADKAKK